MSIGLSVWGRKALSARDFRQTGRGIDTPFGYDMLVAFWGGHFDAESLQGTHQLIYLIEGDRVITLKDDDYEVVPGAGIYLEVSEKDSIRQASRAILRLLHLIVSKIND